MGWVEAGGGQFPVGRNGNVGGCDPQVSQGNTERRISSSRS